MALVAALSEATCRAGVTAGTDGSTREIDRGSAGGVTCRLAEEVGGIEEETAAQAADAAAASSTLYAASASSAPAHLTHSR